MDREDLLARELGRHSRVASRISEPIPHESCVEVSADRSAVCYHHGARIQMGSVYERLLGIIADEGLSVAGDAFEFDVVNYLVTDDPQDYLTCISIPVA